MHLEIITPDSTVFSGEVTLVQLPGVEGSFEILEKHAPLISVLKAGKIKTQEADKKLSYFEIRSGVVEVKDNKVLVLAE